MKNALFRILCAALLAAPLAQAEPKRPEQTESEMRDTVCQLAAQQGYDAMRERQKGAGKSTTLKILNQKYGAFAKHTNLGELMSKMASFVTETVYDLDGADTNAPEDAQEAFSLWTGRRLYALCMEVLPKEPAND